MFTWDDLIPKTLSASPTNQLKVSLGMRAATLRTIEISAKSSLGTSPDRGMITMCQSHSTEQNPQCIN